MSSLLASTFPDPEDRLEYMYAMLLLDSANTPITASAIENVFKAASIPVTSDDVAYMLFLEDRIKSIDIDAVKEGIYYQPHPVEVVDDLLKPEVDIAPEPEDVKDEADEEGDIWRILFPE